MEQLLKSKFCNYCNTDHLLTKEYWYDMRKCKKKTQDLHKTPEFRAKNAKYWTNRYQTDEKHRLNVRQRAKIRGSGGGYKRDYQRVKEDSILNERRKNYTKTDDFKQKRNAKLKKLREINPSRFLAKNLRDRIYCALKGNYKTGSAVKELGCTIDEFKLYLESKFLEGMSWNNRSEWHIDHIIPLASFDLTNHEEFKKACHYTNLQPLWAIDNLRKSDKIA